MKTAALGLASCTMTPSANARHHPRPEAPADGSAAAARSSASRRAEGRTQRPDAQADQDQRADDAEYQVGHLGRRHQRGEAGGGQQRPGVQPQLQTQNGGNGSPQTAQCCPADDERHRRTG